MTNKKKIFLVDDHPIVCEGLSQLLSQEDDLEVCGYAVDAKTAMSKMRSLKPDLAIIDISLAGKSGIELAGEIKSTFPTIRILALSMHSQPMIVDRAMKAGAMGYVNKSEVTNVIVKAVRRVLGGMIYLSDEMSEQLLGSLYGQKQTTDRTRVETLTQREFEILQLIARGLSARDIAEALNISVKTVDVHRDHIKEKFCLKNSRHLYIYASQLLNQSY